MQFTKKERNKIYKKALDIHLKLVPPSYTYLCPHLRSVCGDHLITLGIELPEFDLFDPESGYCAWFNGFTGYPIHYNSQEIKEAQQMILLFCIELTD